MLYNDEKVCATMPNKQSFEFIKVMTEYGIYLGCLIGCVGAIPIALLWFDISILLPVMALFVVIMMCGGLLGMTYGAVSGFLSGVLMTTTTRFIFPTIKREHTYKITMGVLAFVTTVFVFLADLLLIGSQHAELFSKPIATTDWYAVWIMSFAFAVYASQRTANQYLFDLNYDAKTKS